MAYASTNTAQEQTGIRGRIEAFIEARRESAAKRRVFRKTISELETLSSRELSDLGIARSQIRSVAYQAAYSA